MQIKTDRINAFEFAPGSMKSLMAIEADVSGSTLENELLELVKVRASQINGCAFCLDMHAASARKSGVTERRLYLLEAWRESKAYSKREEVALEWTEALTCIASARAPEALFAKLKHVFSDVEIAMLTLAITQINTWNRIAIGLGYEIAEEKEIHRCRHV